MTELNSSPPSESATPSLAPDLLKLPAAEAALIVARRLLADVADRRVRLTDTSNSEALHDFRVALRRLRSWIRAFRPEIGRTIGRKIPRRLRSIARVSNDSRDAEVQLQWLGHQASAAAPDARAGIDWLVTHLRTRKEKSDERISKRLARHFDRTRSSLDDALAADVSQTKRVDDAEAPPTFASTLTSVIATQSERLKLHLAAVRGQQDAAEAHRARIAGKRLRYVLEPVADCVPAANAIVSRLKSLQDALGEWHDAHVLIDTVADAVATVGSERTEQLVAAVRVVGAGSERLTERTTLKTELGLIALAESLHRRATRAFETVRDEWLGARGEALLADAAAIGNDLTVLNASAGRPGLEIERKYLLRDVPTKARDVAPAEIEQGYVIGDELVTRLRHVRENGNERWLRTVKFGKGLVRTELEEEMLPGLFAVMWPLTQGRRVRKRRYAVSDGSLTWEIDEFLDRELVLAEVELPSVDAQASPPDWLAPSIVREVTEEAEYTNEKLAR